MANPIGIRVLKNRASQILRSVREEMAEYVVTHRGKPIAVLRPLDKEEMDRLEETGRTAELAAMRALAGQIASQWT